MMRSLVLTLLLLPLFACERAPIGFEGEDAYPPDGYVPTDVSIDPNGMGMPIGRILLVRKGPESWAIKFTRIRANTYESEYYARYEVHYQKDGSGDFLKENVAFSEKTASGLRPWYFMGAQWHLTDKPYITCGNLKFGWCGALAWVHYPRESYGRYYDAKVPVVELAPTPWTKIGQVRTSDPRIVWYRYDESRARTTVPVDKLWVGEK